jgi:hypothetical protein
MLMTHISECRSRVIGPVLHGHFDSSVYTFNLGNRH